MDIRADIDRVAHDHLLLSGFLMSQREALVHGFDAFDVVDEMQLGEWGLHLPSAKTMIRLLVKDINWHAEAHLLSPQQVRYCIQVHRLQSGSSITVSDGCGHSAECRLEQNEGQWQTTQRLVS